VKIVCLAIFIFCTNYFLQAQNKVNETEYKWESNDGKTTAKISIKPALENANNKTVFYFIALQDSIVENLIDTTSNGIFSALPPSCTAIKIVLSQQLEFQEIPDFFSLSKIVVSEVITFINKNSALPKVDNFIISGVDAGAEIALISALFFPDKFNKTALFFNKVFPDFAYSNQLDVLVPNIKGKLFLHVKQDEDKENVIDKMVNKIALHSSIMLYRIDAQEYDTISFEDGYKWLMADGNNYIIKTE
jgi:hypothetical protein